MADLLRLNFTTSTGEAFPPYENLTDEVYPNAEHGVFGDITLGWVGDVDSARDRDHVDSPDERYDSLIFATSPNVRTFRIDLPDGTYSLRVVAGYPQFAHTEQHLEANGVVFWTATDTGIKEWLDETNDVIVTNGTLEIKYGGGSGASLINFLVLSPASSTRLYLRSTEPADITPFLKRRSGALPAGLDNTAGAIAVWDMSTSKGSGVVSSIFSRISTNDHQDSLKDIFVSAPLDTQVVPAGIWAFVCSCKDATFVAPQANTFALSVYIYRPTSGIATIRIHDADVAIGLNWPGAKGTRGDSFKGESFGLVWGDRLVVEVWQHAIDNAGSGAIQTTYYNGPNTPDVGDSEASPASYLDLPGTLTFATGSDPFKHLGGERVYGQRATMEPWFVCGICGLQRPASDTTVLQAPNARAGMRVCLNDIDETDHGDIRRETPPPTGLDETYRGDE